MTKAAYKTPKIWLTLDACSLIFEKFRKQMDFDEPIPPFNTRYKGKLEGILNSVNQTFGGKYLNPTILDASASYFNQLIRGHPFQNGNKRVAVLFTHYFLLMNGLDYNLSYGEMFNFAVRIAIASELGFSSDRTKDWSKKIIEEFTIDYE